MSVPELCGFGVGTILSTFMWTWLVLPLHGRSARTHLQASSSPTFQGPAPAPAPEIPSTWLLVAPPCQAEAKSKTDWVSVAPRWGQCSLPSLKPDQHLPLMEDPLALSPQPAELSPPGRIWDRLSCVAPWWGAVCFFPSHAWLVQSPPFTWPTLGMFEPDKLCWPHLDNSLRPYPTAKVCKHPGGGSYTWYTCDICLVASDPALGPRLSLYQSGEHDTHLLVTHWELTSCNLNTTRVAFNDLA